MKNTIPIAVALSTCLTGLLTASADTTVVPRENLPDLVKIG
jgi:hypothetical protein